MINTFNQASSYFEATNFTGSLLRTTIPMTRDWTAELVITKNGRTVQANSYFLYNKGFLSVAFEKELSNVDIIVRRKATIRASLLQTIFSYAYVTSWLDGFIEYVQDRAITDYLNGKLGYIFRENSRNFIPPVIRRMVQALAGALVTSLNFLFGKKTLGFISSCLGFPDKNSFVRDEPTVPYDNVVIDDWIPINLLSSITTQNQQTGVTPIEGGMSLVKAISLPTVHPSLSSITLYKAIFNGIYPFYQLPPITRDSSIILCTGGKQTEMRAFVDVNEVVFRFVSANGDFSVTDLSRSLQPISLFIDGVPIPMRFRFLEPDLPPNIDCSTGEAGTVITLADWLG